MIDSGIKPLKKNIDAWDGIYEGESYSPDPKKTAIEVTLAFMMKFNLLTEKRN